MKDSVVARINAGDGTGLWELYDPAMQRSLPLEGTRTFVQRMLDARGHWIAATRAPEECSSTRGTWRVQADRGEWRLRIEVDPEGLLSSLWVHDPPPPDPPVARSSVPMGLPFRGEWWVVWGGDRRAVNHHLEAHDQRRAADLVVVGPEGSTHRGDGRANEDYLAYGEQMLSVADGTVLTVVDGVPENIPGEVNGYAVKGNFVVVRHGPKLFSLYAHLQPGRTHVKPGDDVKRGAVLGLCGNSGHSTEPHLHFQLQDGPDDNTAWGVEAVFERVIVTRDGKTETADAYAFLKGDRIRNP
jgi:hypothetical protein